MWGVLSDDRTGLPFTVASGSRQRSHSQVRVPWDWRPYFTVSGSELPFSSPHATRRATVEVFDPASTRVTELPKPKSMSKLLYDWRLTGSHFVLASSPLRLTTRDFFFPTELLR
jgi:hypothetical protein